MVMCVTEAQWDLWKQGVTHPGAEVEVEEMGLAISFKVGIIFRYLKYETL